MGRPRLRGFPVRIYPLWSCAVEEINTRFSQPLQKVASCYSGTLEATRRSNSLIRWPVTGATSGRPASHAATRTLKNPPPVSDRTPSNPAQKSRWDAACALFHFRTVNRWPRNICRSPSKCAPDGRGMSVYVGPCLIPTQGSGTVLLQFARRQYGSPKRVRISTWIAARQLQISCGVARRPVTRSMLIR